MASIPSTQVTEQDRQVTLIVEGYTKKRRTKKDFTLISNEILRDPQLSKGAKLALIMLISYCWFEKNNCFPGQERLAADLSKSVRTVRRYLTELKEKKYIKTVHRGLGKTNLYTLTIPVNRPKVTDPKQPKMTCPDRTKLTAESDESKHTQVEADEALSNSLGKGFAQVSETGCHIAHMTTRKTDEETGEQSNASNRNTDTTQHTNPPPADRAKTSNTETPPVKERPRRRLLATGISSTAEIMGRDKAPSRPERTPEPPRLAAPPLTQEDMDKRIRERLARERAQNPLPGIIKDADWQQLEARKPTQPTTQCRSRRQPVYETLQLALERISEELGDFTHVTSNITQAENIRRETGAEIEQFIVNLYDARAATKHAAQTGKITKRDAAGRLLKMPYFFAVLRQRLGLKKQQTT